MPSSPAEQTIVFVTGPSGAGRTTAIHALEDFGFEAIDNAPLSLVSRLLATDPFGTQPLALGIDPRTRDFSTDGLLDIVRDVAASGTATTTLLYIDCSLDVLVNRFSETRRKHPLARDEAPRVGIDRELQMLADLRDRADIVVDTTALSPHDLRAELGQWFSDIADDAMAVQVQSFSYKRGIPRGVDMVMDVRFLANPHWEPELRARTGRDQAVASFVASDPQFSSFFDKLLDITIMLLPAYKKEGKSYFSIGLGCTGGQHRSVAVAERLAKGLAERNWQVSIRHRELELRGLTGSRDHG